MNTILTQVLVEVATTVLRILISDDE